jgi:hypothetical protein
MAGGNSEMNAETMTLEQIRAVGMAALTTE